jgi:hypothetical protein
MEIRPRNSPNPKITEQRRNPKREKSILFDISRTMMQPVVTIKCLGEEKTRCNLPGKDDVRKHVTNLKGNCSQESNWTIN